MITEEEKILRSHRGSGNAPKEKFFGKFRGRVSKVRMGPLPEEQVGYDSSGMLFIKAVVTQIGGDKWETNWAAPCLSSPGSVKGEEAKGKYGSYHRPQIGDGVWIEFEQGDYKYPIYTGFWWYKNTFPSEFADKDYLKNLPQGGRNKKTTYQTLERRSQDELVPKETNKQNECNRKLIEKFGLDSFPDGDDSLERLPNVMGEKSPKGFFWLISDDKEHFRVHTPKRSYLLFEDDRNGQAVGTLHAHDLVRLRDEQDLFLELDHDETQKTATLHADDRINLGKNATHPLLYGDQMFWKYNMHTHISLSGSTGPPQPLLNWMSDISQTTYTNTNEGQQLRAMDTAGELVEELSFNEVKNVLDPNINLLGDVLKEVKGMEVAYAKAEAFKYINSSVGFNEVLSVTGKLNEFMGNSLESFLEKHELNDYELEVIGGMVAPFFCSK